VQAGEQVLKGEDADVAQEVATILRQDGIKILVKTKAESVSRKGTRYASRFARENVPSIQWFAPARCRGRTPNTDTLDVTAAGLAIDDRGFIKTDSKLATNVPGVYAMGDIKGVPLYAHFLRRFPHHPRQPTRKRDASIAGRFVPYTVFIDPQLGRVGLTESQAREQKRRIRVAKMPMSYVARALETDESRGFMKAIVDADSKQILGAAVLGVDGGEIMSQIQIAMMGKLPYTVLQDASFPIQPC